MNRDTRVPKLTGGKGSGRRARGGRGDTQYDLLGLSLNLKCKKLYNLHKNRKRNVTNTVQV